MTCDSNGIYESADMRLFESFKENPAKAALAHRGRAETDDELQQEGKWKTYCQLVDYYLAI